MTILIFYYFEQIDGQRNSKFIQQNLQQSITNKTEVLLYFLDITIYFVVRHIM